MLYTAIEGWPKTQPLHRAFADFLEKAEAYSRGALAPKGKGGGTKKGKADPAAVEQACQRTMDLYRRAIELPKT
jgi:hypothetical protein